MSPIAGAALRAGKVGTAGRSPNGQEFIANPLRVWVIDDPDFDRRALFVLVVSSEGEAAFAGDCAREALTEPLLTALGDARLVSLIGTVGEDLQRALAPPTTPSRSEVVLNPQGADPELLSSLDLIGVEVSVPAGWMSSSTICTRVDEGWNDCIPLDRSIALPTTVSAYVGPSRVVEVWLLDEQANLATPFQKLGSVSVPEQTANEGGLLHIDLEGSLAPDGRSVRDPVVTVT